MEEIVVYTIPKCSYCTRAKELLEHHGYEYTERNLDKKEYVETINNEISSEQRNGVILLKAPQIMFGDKLVGGYTELYNKLLCDVSFNEEF